MYFRPLNSKCAFMNVQVINKSKHPLPAYATELSAGMDIRANLSEPITLAPLQRCLADYRGEVCIILVNLSSEPFVIEDGERIAQMVIARHEQAVWQEVEVLDETERGAGGFGHTGRG